MSFFISCRKDKGEKTSTRSRCIFSVSYSIITFLGFNDALTIYTQYANHNYSRLLSDARGLTAVNDYDGAVSLLSQIDPSSKCSKEASALILSIQKEIDTEVAFEKKFVQQEIQTQIDLEKRRIDAIKEIAKAYASSQPQIYYKQIVKY